MRGKRENALIPPQTCSDLYHTETTTAWEEQCLCKGGYDIAEPVFVRQECSVTKRLVYVLNAERSNEIARAVAKREKEKARFY